MKYALVNGERQEAQSGFSGKCPCCGQPTVARCGDERVDHWAHKGKRECDPWWENETEWHRAWKGQFPKEWQEFIQYAEDGEKHIADVKTDQGYVVEFQHSFIRPEERQVRENFYKTMIWIVDGKRRLRDQDKFIGIWEQSTSLDKKIEVRNLFGYFFDESALLRDWGSSKAPVFFDFGGDELWGLFPKDFLVKTSRERRYAFKIKRNELISFLLPAAQVNFAALLQGFTNLLIGKEKLAETLATAPQSFQPWETNHSIRQRQMEKELILSGRPRNR